MNTKLEDEIRINCRKNNLPVYDIIIFHIINNLKDYLKFLNNMYDRKDYNGYYDYIVFPENLEDDEEIKDLNKNKICFGFHDYMDIVDCTEVYKYLEISTGLYLKYYPEKKQEIINLLEKIKDKYL